ncbi:9306_t:CDS:2, partial [Ambispora leptoticha]
LQRSSPTKHRKFRKSPQENPPKVPKVQNKAHLLNIEKLKEDLQENSPKVHLTNVEKKKTTVKFIKNLEEGSTKLYLSNVEKLEEKFRGKSIIIRLPNIEKLKESSQENL